MHAAVDGQRGPDGGGGQRAGQVRDRGRDLVGADQPPRSAGAPAGRPSSRSGSGVASASRWTHGVSAVPGTTQLTRIPSPTWSAAMARVRASTAPLVALYRARLGRPTTAAIEQVFTIAAAGERRSQQIFPRPADRFVAEFLGYENFLTAADGTPLDHPARTSAPRRGRSRP